MGFMEHWFRNLKVEDEYRPHPPDFGGFRIWEFVVQIPQIQFLEFLFQYSTGFGSMWCAGVWGLLHMSAGVRFGV